MKRYIDVYSASSIIGFSPEDLLHISDLYAKAEENRSCCSEKLLFNSDEICSSSLPYLKRQIDAYSNFLLSIADLARSKWTEFNLEMMGVGFGIMLISLSVYLFTIKRMINSFGVYLSSFGDSDISFRLLFACFMVMIRACSFLSNSFICKYSF